MNPFEILSTARIVQVNDVLGKDVRRCMDELRAGADDRRTIDQFWARTLLRIFHSHVEAITWEQRLIVRSAHAAGLMSLSEEEAGALAEVVFDLDDRARPVRRSRFTPTDRMVRFAFHLFARAYGLADRLDVSGPGWQKFLKTLTIRNRITHPKEPSALEITVQEGTQAMEALTWYFLAQGELINRCGAQLTNPAFVGSWHSPAGAPN
jgi:hypothetical protein